MKNSPTEINTKVWIKYTWIKKNGLTMSDSKGHGGLAIREKAGSLNSTLTAPVLRVFAGSGAEMHVR